MLPHLNVGSTDGVRCEPTGKEIRPCSRADLIIVGKENAFFRIASSSRNKWQSQWRLRKYIHVYEQWRIQTDTGCNSVKNGRS